MAAPNRSTDVARIFQNLTIVPKTDADDGRRANLFAVVRTLNKQDRGKWGVLVKTDQGNKIPADVIVWRPTMEHFDVILGSGGPAWQAKGVVSNRAWHWQDVNRPVPEPLPGPTPGPPPAPGPSYVDTLDAATKIYGAYKQASGKEMNAEFFGHLMWRYLREGFSVEVLLEDARTRGASEREDPAATSRRLNRGSSTRSF